MHWSYKYLGLPWVAYASGPDAYDCWGLVHHCLKEYFGLEVDRFLNVITNDKDGINSAVDKQIAAGGWVQITEPQEGAVVLMSKKTLIHHIGLFTDGVVLHTRDGVDVSRETVSTLQSLGFKRIEYWIHERLLTHS